MKVTTNGALTVQLDGWERLAAFRSQISVDRAQITAVNWHERYRDPGRALRVAGTALPKVVYAGHFRRAGQREFWFLRGARGFRITEADSVLEVETTDPKCTRLLLSMSSDESERLTAWFNGRTL